MSGPEIPAEVVERMVALVRDMVRVSRNVGDTALGTQFLEARCISELLPEPVDPDLVEAREVVCGYHHDKHPESFWHVEQAEVVRSGRFDRMLDVQAAYHGIKRGRELERGA